VDNIKKILGLFFFFILIIGIIFGYRYGKKLASKNSHFLNEENIYFENDIKKGKENRLMARLLQPLPEIFEFKEKSFGPLYYPLKVYNINEKMDIINEKGEKVSSLQSEKLTFNIFALNLLDSDLKKENELQKIVKFKIEPEPEAEYYPGIVENNLEKREGKTNVSKVKVPNPETFTN